MSTVLVTSPCPYCGSYHNSACPRVKAIEYHPNGTVKRIEFFTEAEQYDRGSSDA